MSEDTAPLTPDEPGEPHTDALPEDLDVTNFVGPTVFPDVAKRRVAGTIYLVLAVTCLAQWTQSSNEGVLAVGVLLALIGGYHFLAGWQLKIDETEGLVIATPHRRVPGRPRLRAARLVRAPEPARVAHPALQRGRTSEPARPGRVRRRRRPRDR